MSSSSGYIIARGNACLSCRSKHQKCDGAKPKCANCTKRHRDCVYVEPPKSQAQLLIDRMEELRNRVDHFTPEQLAQLYAGRDSSGSSRSRETPSPPRGSGEESGSSATRGRPGQVPGAGMVWNYSASAPTQPPTSISPQTRDDMIRIFFQNRDQALFDIDVARFYYAYALPPTDPRSPHPALVEAIVLVGCYLSRAPSYAAYEDLLLRQAIQQLPSAFHDAASRHDFLRASSLIAFYYVCKGMNVEAYHHINASAHVAVGGGLHRLVSSVWRPPSPRDQQTYLPHPKDAVELGERFHSFWQAFALDKVIALVTSQPATLPGLPTVYDPLMQVTTPWPRTLQDYSTGNVSDMEHNSVASLFSPHQVTFGSRPETLVSLRTQSLMLVQRAAEIMSAPTGPEDFVSTDTAVQNFISRLPRINVAAVSGAGMGLSADNQQLVLVHTAAYVAALILHQHGADERAHRRCAMALQGLMASIQVLSDFDYANLFVGLGFLWFLAGRIFMGISLAAPGAISEQNRAAAFALMEALRRLSMVYPRALGFQLQQLQQMLHQRQ